MTDLEGMPMARYSGSATKTSGAAAAWVFQLRQPSTSRDMRVFEVGIFTTTAVAGTVTLERSNSVGATFTSTSGAAEDPQTSAGTVVIDTAITTAPTRLATPAPFRTVSFPATAGSGAIWTFPTGLVVSAGSGLLIWQTSAAAVGYAVYFAWDE